MTENEEKKTQSKSNPPKKIDMSGWDFGWMVSTKKIFDKFGNVIGFTKE